MKKVQKNKLHFEKPNIAGAEFMACLVPIVSVQTPEIAGTSFLCELPMIGVVAPVAVGL